MDCIKNNKRGAEILMDYCAGTADPGAAAEIDAHTKTCAECRSMVEAQRAVWEMLDAWTPVEVSRDFDSRLYARIAGEQTAPAWRRWWSRLIEPATPHAWWKPMVSLAVAGAIVSMALIVRMPEQNGMVAQKGTTAVTQQIKAASTGNDGTAAEEIDLQQVQQALDDLDVVSPLNQAPLNQAPANQAPGSRL
jgi:anti-sigma factor RsiW